MSRAICLFHCIFLHTPNLVVYCLLITIALDRLSHVSVRLTIVAYHWIDCPYHWIDCHMCQFGLRLSQNTGSILAYHWINCRLARVVACEYSRIASYLYILGIRVVRIGSKSLPTPPRSMAEAHVLCVATIRLATICLASSSIKQRPSQLSRASQLSIVSENGSVDGDVSF